MIACLWQVPDIRGESEEQRFRHLPGEVQSDGDFLHFIALGGGVFFDDLECHVSRAAAEPAAARDMAGLQDVVDVGGVHGTNVNEAQVAILMRTASGEDLNSPPAVRQPWMGAEGVFTGVGDLVAVGIRIKTADVRIGKFLGVEKLRPPSGEKVRPVAETRGDRGRAADREGDRIHRARNSAGPADEVASRSR